MIALVVLAGAVYLALPQSVTTTSGTKLWHSLSWRLLLYSRKALGGVPDLSWQELLEMTKPDSGFVLTPTVSEGRSLDAAVINPLIGEKDRAAGEGLFKERCIACHDGSGLRAPLLNHAGYRHGDSDLAIYKVLRDGIAATAMPSFVDLSIAQRWQVVGYVRSLQARKPISAGGKLPQSRVRVSWNEIAAGENSDAWLTYSGSLNGFHHSPLAQITPDNVSRLRVVWVRQFSTDDQVIQATPLVADGVLFISEPPANVIAYDTRSGNAIWKYERRLPDDLHLCCGRVNRGVAVLDDKVFLGSLDGYLVALDANDGHVLWEVQVADPADGYSITGAPLVANRSVVVGVAGGEYGIRGSLAAYDAQSGSLQWRFNTIPGPGEAGHETWQNEAWRTGGGPTWITGSYDPSLDLLYWGVGNPAPVYAGDARPGDNLFTNSVIALHASTGKLAWHFQFTPHDEHDWDSNQTPILADIRIGGTVRKVICWANRNGFYYVLDRLTGAFILGKPFVEINWAKGLDEHGRPILAKGVVAEGVLTRPGVGGGTNWQNPAFDQNRGLIFIPATEGASVFTKTAADHVERRPGQLFVGSGSSWAAPPIALVRALDAASGTARWEHLSPPASGHADSGYSGLLVTEGGLVFGASAGSLFALNAETGEECWRVSLGGATRAAPISFSIEGRQVIAVSAGRALFVFGL